MVAFHGTGLSVAPEINYDDVAFRCGTEEELSHMTLSRRHGLSSSITKDSVSYSLLDATKQQNFLNAFDKSAFRSQNEFLLAYKPRRGKYAVLVDDFSSEEVENFVGSVLSGDVQFSKVKQKPVVK